MFDLPTVGTSGQASAAPEVFAAPAAGSHVDIMALLQAMVDADAQGAETFAERDAPSDDNTDAEATDAPASAAPGDGALPNLPPAPSTSGFDLRALKAAARAAALLQHESDLRADAPAPRIAPSVLEAEWRRPLAEDSASEPIDEASLQAPDETSSDRDEETAAAADLLIALASTWVPPAPVEQANTSADATATGDRVAADLPATAAAPEDVSDADVSDAGIASAASLAGTATADDQQLPLAAPALAAATSAAQDDAELDVAQSGAEREASPARPASAMSQEGRAFFQRLREQGVLTQIDEANDSAKPDGAAEDHIASDAVETERLIGATVADQAAAGDDEPGPADLEPVDAHQAERRAALRQTPTSGRFGVEPVDAAISAPEAIPGGPADVTAAASVDAGPAVRADANAQASPQSETTRDADAVLTSTLSLAVASPSNRESADASSSVDGGAEGAAPDSVSSTPAHAAAVTSAETSALAAELNARLADAFATVSAAQRANAIANRSSASELARALGAKIDPRVAAVAAAQASFSSLFVEPPTPLTAGQHREPSYSSPDGRFQRDRAELLSPARAAHAVQVFAAVEQTAAGETMAVAEDAPSSSAPLPNESAVSAAIVQSMRVQYRNGVGTAVVNLDPGYLGAVTIALQVDRGSVIATLHAANSDVRAWLQANEAVLRQGLAEKGLSLDRLVVSEEEREEPTSRDPEQRESSKQHERQRRAPRRDDTATFEVVV